MVTKHIRHGAACQSVSSCVPFSVRLDAEKFFWLVLDRGRRLAVLVDGNCEVCVCGTRLSFFFGGGELVVCVDSAVGSYTLAPYVIFFFFFSVDDSLYMLQLTVMAWPRRWQDNLFLARIRVNVARLASLAVALIRDRSVR